MICRIQEVRIDNQHGTWPSWSSWRMLLHHLKSQQFPTNAMEKPSLAKDVQLGRDDGCSSKSTLWGWKAPVGKQSQLQTRWADRSSRGSFILQPSYIVKLRGIAWAGSTSTYDHNAIATLGLANRLIDIDNLLISDFVSWASANCPSLGIGVDMVQTRKRYAKTWLGLDLLIAARPLRLYDSSFCL